jgi:hypothetical protein
MFSVMFLLCLFCLFIQLTLFVNILNISFFPLQVHCELWSYNFLTSMGGTLKDCAFLLVTIFEAWLKILYN